MEAAFGHDFSRVRVHDDHWAAESSARIGANAYTVGSHVFLGQGRDDLASSSGKRLLAHELAHVVQLGDAPSAPPHALAGSAGPAGSEGPAVSHDAAVEQEARAAESYCQPGRSAHHPPAAHVAACYSRPGRCRTVRRSPFVEELVTQGTEAMALAQGMRLSPVEVDLARGVFGNSIDYAQVRLLHASEARRSSRSAT